MTTETMHIVASRKGRLPEVIFEQSVTTGSIAEVVDGTISMLRCEKSVTKGHTRPEHDVHERLTDYSDLSDLAASEYIPLRDDRDGMPRRIIFGNAVPKIDEVDIHSVGREKPFRALRTHEFGPDFDSVDLVFEEVVKLRPEGSGGIEGVNARIDPMDTDAWVVSDFGNTVYHTFMADPELPPSGSGLDRDFVTDYVDDLCISSRYERLVEAALGTRCLDDTTFAYPNDAPEEEATIAETGIDVYLTMTGSTAREHGLALGEHLFPSETVLMENVTEATPAAETVKRVTASPELETELKV